MPSLPPLSHSSRQTQTISSTISPPARPPTHILCCALWGNRWRHMGTFPLVPLTTVNRAALSRFSLFLPVWELRSRCSAAAAKPGHGRPGQGAKPWWWWWWGSVLKGGGQRDLLKKLAGVCFLSNIGVITNTSSGVCFGLKEPLSLSWSGERNKTPHFQHSSVEPQTTGCLALTQTKKKVNRISRLLHRVIRKHTGNENSHFPAALSCRRLLSCCVNVVHLQTRVCHQRSKRPALF